MKRVRATLLVLAVIGAIAAPGTAAAAPGSAAAPGAVAAAALADATHGPIEGSGSSWSANAVNQWIADVDAQSLQVVFTASGSAQGRKDYSFRNVDFAVSDIPFQGRDPISGEPDTSNGRPYAYLPIVAGGTSFPYQIRVGGQLIRDLRLSGLTLAKIFTNQITKWNDPQITADNNGRKLPAIPIIPVVHSEGSGSTAQFTAYLAQIYPSLWAPFNSGINHETEYFPHCPNTMNCHGNDTVFQNGSDGVMNFIGEASANGAIGYDEYSYALNKNYPVVKLENAAHYFTLPTQYNVAKTLTQAVINRDPTSPNYLIQDLTNVYTYNDVRTYPLSSYSYMVLPTGTNSQDPRLTTAKRQTLTDFLYYSICLGQREMGPIGYSPLPVNLVQAGFDQIQKLKTADSGVDITRRDVGTCNNPTFVPGQPNANYLAQIAPLPPACDKRGAGPCAAGVTPNPTGIPPRPGSGGQPGATPSAGTPGAGATPTTGVSVDPDTGQIIGGGPANNGGPAGGANGTPQNAAADLADAPASGANKVLAPLIVVELLAVLIVPVLIGRLMAGRRDPR